MVAVLLLACLLMHRHWLLNACSHTSGKQRLAWWQQGPRVPEQVWCAQLMHMHVCTHEGANHMQHVGTAGCLTRTPPEEPASCSPVLTLRSLLRSSEALEPAASCCGSPALATAGPAATAAVAALLRGLSDSCILTSPGSPMLPESDARRLAFLLGTWVLLLLELDMLMDDSDPSDEWCLEPAARCHSKVSEPDR
jgi:hypothetical protein